MRIRIQWMATQYLWFILEKYHHITILPFRTIFMQSFNFCGAKSSKKKERFSFTFRLLRHQCMTQSDSQLSFSSWRFPLSHLLFSLLSGKYLVTPSNWELSLYSKPRSIHAIEEIYIRRRYRISNQSLFGSQHSSWIHTKYILCGDGSIVEGQLSQTVILGRKKERMKTKRNVICLNYRPISRRQKAQGTHNMIINWDCDFISVHHHFFRIITMHNKHQHNRKCCRKIIPQTSQNTTWKMSKFSPKQMLINIFIIRK